MIIMDGKTKNARSSNFGGVYMPQRVISPKQIEAVLKLSGPERYDHFIKHVADCREAWGLWKDGWAMGEDDSGVSTFPIWPAKEYAALSADGPWRGYEPSSIPLGDLVDELLPKLEEDGILPSVFRTP